ncbi:uncharacterized protein EV422DRAFT_321329 [Fimicolochytrium jonesii]|uniref:uncharacterized protein n=1 Tax=Fimicolochytrium jonesii TaxID=1396493 RepID=UPI0022FF3437|nr:uncharacterized protein EV422DRAFT_321329 [Fimicolochytrium jonesii]KAI8824462.1 hypothetical protein EV422DRAFT_321329 [Fimicolochytrium jonesii]
MSSSLRHRQPLSIFNNNISLGDMATPTPLLYKPLLQTDILKAPRRAGPTKTFRNSSNKGRFQPKQQSDGLRSRRSFASKASTAPSFRHSLPKLPSLPPFFYRGASNYATTPRAPPQNPAPFRAPSYFDSSMPVGQAAPLKGGSIQKARPRPATNKRKSFDQTGRTDRRHRHWKNISVYGRPKNWRRKGDFYRPPAPENLSCSPTTQVDGEGATDSHLKGTSKLSAHSSPPTLTDAEVDDILDEAFADLGWNVGQQSERAGDEDEDEEDNMTPPLADWIYPTEIYEADRKKFFEMGGTSLDRSFIGCTPPPNILADLDLLP